MPPRVTSLRPMLAVRDLPATVRFYVETLGFNCRVMFGRPPVWAVAELLDAPRHAGVDREERARVERARPRLPLKVGRSSRIVARNLPRQDANKSS